MSDSRNGNGSRSGRPWWSLFRGRPRNVVQDLTPFRRMALQLHHELPRTEGNRSVLLAAAAESRLCARSAALLATCMADQTGLKVLLVDGDDTGAGENGVLECNADRGFSDILADPRLPLGELVHSTSHELVEFLPAGRPEKASRAKYTENVDTVLRIAEKQYDFVIISGGSVLRDPMTLDLAPHVGFVLLMAIENETRMEELDAASAALNFCKAGRIGLVLSTHIKSEWLTL